MVIFIKRVTETLFKLFFGVINKKCFYMFKNDKGILK